MLVVDEASVALAGCQCPEDVDGGVAVEGGFERSLGAECVDDAGGAVAAFVLAGLPQVTELDVGGGGIVQRFLNGRRSSQHPGDDPGVGAQRLPRVRLGEDVGGAGAVAGCGGGG